MGATFTPLLADAARFARHSPGDRWLGDETYVKVNEARRYIYRGIDQHGRSSDVLFSARSDAAARRFFHRHDRSRERVGATVFRTTMLRSPNRRRAGRFHHAVSAD